MYLFVQEGCRPCLYVETQLKKVDGWEKVVSITNAGHPDEWSEFAKECGVEGTPTLVAFVDDKIVAKISGAEYMTFDFWKATIKKHGGN